MKRIKAIVILITTGFFMFAPPGTLILGVPLILGLLGVNWLFVGVALCLGTLIFMWLFYRKKSAWRSDSGKRD